MNNLDDELKERVIVLIKSILNNDRDVINKTYSNLKKDEDVRISIVEDYGSNFKLHIQKSKFNIEFNFEYDDDYLPF